MKHVLLNRLLPPDGLAEIQSLIDSGKRSAADFKPVTNRYREQLLVKGVDADYLAYAIEHILMMTTENAGDTGNR